MNPVTRRSVMAGAAAAVAAVPVVGLAATKAKPSPEERIEAAIAEIKAAMLEKHPDWRVQVQNDKQDSIRGPNQDVPVAIHEPYSHAVIIYSSTERYGREEVSLVRRHLSWRKA